MSIRRWEMILELQKRKSNLGDVERVVLITDRIEELSGKQCFYTPNKPKKCSCLSTLQGDSNAMDAIGSYILFWAKLNPLQQKIMLIEKIKAIHVAERLIFLCNGDSRNKFKIEFDLYMQAFSRCFAFIWYQGIYFS
jgi:hypothetical protein